VFVEVVQFPDTVIPFSLAPKPSENICNLISSSNIVLTSLTSVWLHSTLTVSKIDSNSTTTALDPSIPGGAGGAFKFSSIGGKAGIAGANGLGGEGGGFGAGFSGGAGG